MEQTIGNLAAAVVNPDRATGFSTPALTQPWAGTMPATLSDDQMAELAMIARSPACALPPVDPKRFAKIMGSMAAVLPKRNVDDATGEAMLKIYHRMFGHQPEPALAFLAKQAIATCKWFPTIAECNEILAKWKRPADPRQGAREQIAEEMQARLDRDIAALRAGRVTQADVDAWPPRWRQIGITQGYLDADGTLRFSKEGAQ
ncbi:hypothetical protein C7451_106128 [Blastomonas natatoria]|uniref:Uncharacterized protein n=2 Tax=Blastomonas natatoria TaxID=34015 RepID=A0A2V3V4D2_9SPHN|nr:hypothetical protein C7451_106128 [Blastomonas natatoria]